MLPNTTDESIKVKVSKEKERLAKGMERMEVAIKRQEAKMKEEEKRHVAKMKELVANRDATKAEVDVLEQKYLDAKEAFDIQLKASTSAVLEAHMQRINEKKK